MPPLPTDLRRNLEKVVLRARDAAEEGASNALTVLAVAEERAYETLAGEQRALRNGLRARMRVLAPSDTTHRAVNGHPRGFGPLVEEVAYEQWHRMLFARFLEANHLLIHPRHGVAVSLEECAELARDEGEPDEWMVAAKFASEMLPGIFRRDDPAAQVRFAIDDRAELEAILKTLPDELFLADDALGWVYQFWQSKAKREVNASERKIGGEDLAPVTQLFTEHYLVRFLLENSLGAWWAARHPGSPLLKEFEYLRFRDDGTPAAGTFEGWPERARDVTVMDPCCGSGHFLVAAADMLRKIRMEEEGLSAAEAAEAVLRENLFGLELDPRCTQLAMFALVFDAWKAGLSPKATVIPNIACSGIPVSGQLDDWLRLARGNTEVEHTLRRLHELFRNAQDLGSLINPAALSPKDQLFTSRYEDVAPLLHEALRRSGDDDPAVAVFGATAEGVERAGRLLSRQYTLVATNPPYLSRGKQSEAIKAFADVAHREAKADLATMFIERCRAFTADDGAYAMVTPQNWLFLGSYRKLRERLLREQAWGHVSRLGPGAFDTISGEVVNVALLVAQQCSPAAGHVMTGIDASEPRMSAQKARLLREGPLATVEQQAQLRNPDARIVFGGELGATYLSAYCFSSYGSSTGDGSRWIRKSWELLGNQACWARFEGSVVASSQFDGNEELLYWGNDGSRWLNDGAARIEGFESLGHQGVLVSLMGALPCSLYLGAMFDKSTATVIPREDAHLLAIWAFCSSPLFNKAVRRIDQALKVTSASLLKVPFDLDYWQKEAVRLYPDGLPEPFSDDPTQWLFRGNIVGSETPLQVAVARLLGYRWPDQPPDGDLGVEPLDHLVDRDGIVCLPSVSGEKEAAERLRAFLAEAHAHPPSGSRPRGAPPWPALPAESGDWIADLLAQAGFAGRSLADWLRDGFFEQHCKLFHHRPFIWQVWDGRRDGFSALVNYHGLDHAKLQKLTYSYLGSWIERQQFEAGQGTPGAEDRLAAAQALQKKLAAILEGEPPYDIHVRWKKLQEQPVGWNPDLDDGVRLNIRPFMTAGVLRWKPNINWNKDRGKNPDGSERLNDLHHTNAEKQDARRKAGTG
jgi:hypothetical protein